MDKNNSKRDPIAEFAQGSAERRTTDERWVNRKALLAIASEDTTLDDKGDRSPPKLALPALLLCTALAMSVWVWQLVRTQPWSAMDSSASAEDAHRRLEELFWLWTDGVLLFTVFVSALLAWLTYSLIRHAIKALDASEQQAKFARKSAAYAGLQFIGQEQELADRRDAQTAFLEVDLTPQSVCATQRRLYKEGWDPSHGAYPEPIGPIYVTPMLNGSSSRDSNSPIPAVVPADAYCMSAQIECELNLRALTEGPAFDVEIEAEIIGWRKETLQLFTPSALYEDDTSLYQTTVGVTLSSRGGGEHPEFLEKSRLYSKVELNRTRVPVVTTAKDHTLRLTVTSKYPSDDPFADDYSRSSQWYVGVSILLKYRNQFESQSSQENNLTRYEIYFREDAILGAESIVDVEMKTILQRTQRMGYLVRMPQSNLIANSNIIDRRIATFDDERRLYDLAVNWIVKDMPGLASEHLRKVDLLASSADVYDIAKAVGGDLALWYMADSAPDQFGDRYTIASFLKLIRPRIARRVELLDADPNEF